VEGQLNKNILCVCSGTDVLQASTPMLEAFGFQVYRAHNLLQVTQLCDRVSFQLAIVGSSLSSLEKVRSVTVLKEDCPKCQVIIIAGRPNEQLLGLSVAHYVYEEEIACLPELMKQVLERQEGAA
jgi:DNA-binding NtrC family response regulator